VRGTAPAAARAPAFAQVDMTLAAAASGVALSDHAEALSALLSEATSEYGIGVVEGEIVTPHEYQDAWGFIRAANFLFAARKADYVAANAAAAADAEAKLAAAEAAFPDILSETPPAAATIRATTTQAALALLPFRQGA
jgi:poly-gamma-glutamate capsule biosynthesis protein CapA/YwtB (metallophosphatase superfamily)